MAPAEAPASHPTTTTSDAQQPTSVAPNQGQPQQQAAYDVPNHSYSQQQTAYATQNQPNSQQQTAYAAPNYSDSQQQTAPNAAHASTYANTSDLPIDADVLQLIKTKTEYYVPQFQTIKNKKNKKNKRVWNWSAFLFGPFWMIYRKMYLYGFIHLAILSAALIFLSTYSITGYYLLGPIGNSIYMLTLEKRAGKAKAMAEPQRSQYLKKKSGVNPIAAVLSVIGYAILIFICYMVYVWTRPVI